MLKDLIKDLESSGSSSGPKSKVNVVNMQAKINQGTIYFVPFSPLDGSDSITVIKDVIEIKDFYEFTDKNDKNKKLTGQRWLKLLNISNLGELSESQKSKYEAIRSKFKSLSRIKFHSNSKISDQRKWELTRTKSYTILAGYILRHDQLYPQKNSTNYSKTVGLLVFSSVNFNNALSLCIRNKSKLVGNDQWLAKLSNNNLTDRTYFLSFNFYLMNKDEGIGYKSTVSVEMFTEDTMSLTDGKPKLDLSHVSDQLNKLYDSKKLFLNLGQDDSLFNDTYVKNFDEAIDKLKEKYAKYNDGSIGADESSSDNINSNDLPF